MSDQEPEVKAPGVLPGHSWALQPTRWSLWAANGYDQATDSDSNPVQGRDLAAGGRSVIALIDKYAFTRECIAASLQTAGSNFGVVTHASCADLLQGNATYDLILFHWHGADEEAEKNELAAAEFKSVTALAPLVVLGASERSELISSAFENGARGYIPIRNTSAALAIGIMRVVRDGGTYAPASSLPLHGTRFAGEPAGTRTSRELTPRELAVLKFLKQGKANKTIAHELHLSESTVKAHIRNIMKKLNVKSRTGIVCCAYTTPKLVA
jgi:DNA-binding NarL/FixJ family response regulator